MDKPGATGRFPDGKLQEDDKGELAMEIVVTATGLVAINFGAPVLWTAMPPSMARELAARLIECAEVGEAEIERQKKP